MTKSGKSLVFGSLAVCISASLWGLDGILLTPQLYNLNIVFVVFILHALPFLLMNFFLFREYKLFSRLTTREIIYLALIALTGGALGTMAIVKALFLVEFKDLSIVVLLQKLQPVFAIALAAVLLREKLNRSFVFWASMAIIAGYFLTFGFNFPDFNTGSKTMIAAGYSLIAAFCFGAATVLGKGVLHNLSFQAATFYRYGFTSLIMLVFVVVTGNMSGFVIATPTNWLIIVIISLTVGSGAIFLYYFGLKKVTAMLAAICELCFPLSAIVFDYLFHGKVLSPVQWASVALMLLAIIRLSTQRRGAA
ncbi:Riboflavin transporter ImpX [bioreactor metagenome]|jgi:drug/metabolite transporter (DMT)-like permease|uniref:Riboflavin transporter ImpX n=1 Tax=bioreactor metagenome TaxID=1076179 RepID=A0A644TZA4_9ZZZZ|nr:DMT family transporter [Lentimicrobium sp.]MEA5110089.1 DMT family transporter [Lentimicrobium sp.]HCT71293.1 EamA family transporter [Bacteroidales bacterium]